MTLTLEAIREHCLKMNGLITEELPFSEDVLVFKVHGRIFLLTVLGKYPLAISLKCDPEHAIELRERFEAVEPAWHMSKKHWITVTIDGSIPANEVLEMIDHSYAQVVSGLPKLIKQQLAVRES